MVAVGEQVCIVFGKRQVEAVLVPSYSRLILEYFPSSASATTNHNGFTFD